jgi:hypothetical protein
MRISRQYMIDLEWAAIVFWVAVLIVEFWLKDRAPRVLRVILWLPGKYLRLVLVIATLGLLVGCSNPDPLAIASGPLYQLNAGHWQLTSQDLSAPPPVTHN